MSANSNTFSALDGPINSGRQGASPTSSHGGQVNGNGMSNANYMAPLPVGHQQDLNFLYSQLQELGTILRSNREKVNVITKTAEEVAVSASRLLLTNCSLLTNLGRSEQMEPMPTERAAKSLMVSAILDLFIFELTNKAKTAARIRELEHELAKANHIISLYKHEQTENTKLIAGYEDALGTATEQIRNYCSDINGRFLEQRRYYNNLLQQEKDEHLQSRLDRDSWHAKTARVCEMIRTAYRLRCDEDNEELEVVSGLQAEVRIYRKCLGMEREKPEEETGWKYLKNAPLNIEGCEES